MNAPTDGIRSVESGRLHGTTYGESTYKVNESCHDVPPNQPPILVTWLLGGELGEIPFLDLCSIQRHLKRRCVFIVPMNPKAADDGRRFFWGVSYTKAQNKRALGFIFGEPHDPFLEDLCSLIAYVAQEVDANRIYVAGYSMGGFGAFQLGAFKPEIFDAVISVAGYGQGTYQPETEGYCAPQPQSSLILQEWIARCAPKLAQVSAVMVVHAETDLNSSYMDALAIVKGIQAEGGPGHVELITVPEEMAESDPRKRKVLKSGHCYFNYALIHDSSKEVHYYPLEEILSDGVVQEQTETSSQSTCLRVVDSKEDPELHKTSGKGETSRSTYLRVDDSGEDPELHKILGVSSTDPLTENATWWTSVVMCAEGSAGSAQGSGNDQGGGISCSSAVGHP